MVQIDTSDFKRLADVYKGRIASMRARPLGDDTSAIGFAVKDLFKDVLMDNDGVTLSEQKRFYRESNQGYYGSGWQGHALDKINPQEFIDPGARPVWGKGRFYQDSDVSFQPNGSGATVDLFTMAEMQPYPHKDKGGNLNFNLPQRPIMYYFKHGWVDPEHTSHHMKPRPFGKRVAAAGAERGVIGKFIGAILRSAGFRQR